MGSFSIWHWLVVFLIIALIFGTKKLRNIGADLGGAVKGFKEGMREAERPIEQSEQSEQSDSSQQSDSPQAAPLRNTHTHTH